MAHLLRARRWQGRSGDSRWDVAVRPPSARLRPFVHGDYVGYTEWSGRKNRRREFPVPFVVMVIEFGPPLRLYEEGDPRRVVSHPGGFVGGLCEDFVVCEHDGFQQGIQINLTPVGARRLFNTPMSEFMAQVHPIRDVLPTRHRRLAERLQDIADWDQRFDLLDDTLADCLHEPSVRTSVVSWAVERIQEAGGALSIRALSRELGYSGKHVISMFRDQVGIPPKLLARIVRFDRLIRHFRNGGGGAWSDLALEFGFYDQAHLVRDVRHFTGVTPTEAKAMVTRLDGLAS
jgi:AraC-like DNA-binding protein